MINELTFNGKSFSEFSAYIATSNFLDGAAKDIQSVSVVGRSGALQLSNDKYNNLTLKVRMYITNDMQENMRKMRNFLESCWGYCRYEETQTPNEFRMASFKAAFVPDVYDVNVGVVDLTFDSMPQRFLKTGENWTTVSSSSSEISGNPVTIDNPSGLTALTGLNVDIQPVQDLNGYDAPWVGGAGKNKLPSHAVGSTTITGVTFTVSTDGSIALSGTATARTDFLISTFNVPNTPLKISGAPSGGSAKWNIRIDLTASGEANQCYDDGSETASRTMNTAVGTQVKAVIRVYSGINVNGLVFYPMLRLASDTDATYEPYSNICPITGHTSASVTRTGKNMLPSISATKTMQGITFTAKPDGSVTVDGTNTGNGSAYIILGGPSSLPRNSLLNKAITISGGKNGVYVKNWNYNGQGGSKSSSNGGETTYTFTNADADYNFAVAVSPGVTVNNVTVYPMVRPAGTSAEFEPYTGQTYTINLNGTRYGGTLDALTGMLTVTHGFKTFDGSENWGLQDNGRRVSLGGNPLTGVKVVAGINRTIGATSNLFVEENPSATWNGTIGFSIEADGVFVVRQFTSNTMTVANWKTLLSSTPMQVCYPLQTPQTVQLTAQQISLLTGTNIISTDMNSLTVTIASPAELENPTLFESKPLIRVYGNGTLNVNDQYITVANSPYTYIDIDCELMDCYHGSNNANQYVSFSTTDYVTLGSGINYFSYSGFTKVEVTPRWYEI